MPDRDHFLSLFLRCEADLRAFIGSVVLDRHAREDVLQECALTLWRELEKYDPARSFGAWARGVAANVILQRRHKDRRFPVAFSPETIEAVLSAYDRTEDLASARSDALVECVRRLPDRSRELLEMRYERDLKPSEIAQRTGRTLDAIYQALSRIRLKLEECIRARLAADAGGA